jgi:hypothetical protein
MYGQLAQETPQFHTDTFSAYPNVINIPYGEGQKMKHKMRGIRHRDLQARNLNAVKTIWTAVRTL